MKMAKCFRSFHFPLRLCPSSSTIQLRICLPKNERVCKVFESGVREGESKKGQHFEVIFNTRTSRR